MKRPTPTPDNVEQLIALCLELYEGRGASAVDEVLAGHPDSADLVRERLDLLGRMGLVSTAPRDAVPDAIGPYRIVRELGSGGMGIVYEAEQERPRRNVALKVLRSLPGELSRARFRHEAELLARLQHPGIATVYEVGAATVGGMTAPYLAMELIEGLPLDRYANENGLDARERLELVAKIADAVHHAHQRGVVHRDLKPGNVLVDPRGEPRVLDFGIARAVDPDLKLESLRTASGQLVGTLTYMSPEQAAGDPDEVDSRADVYSLGVVAFELLAGRLPLEVEGLGVLEALRVVRDDEPPRLGALDRALRGDVETIVAKALSKEKERRYASAHELAADVRRHLADEPIAARPATAAYQFGKLARRHRVLVGAAAAVVAALVLGLVGTLHGLAQARAGHLDAERRFQHANVVLTFQKNLFATADPQGVGIQVEDLLDRGVLQAASGPADELDAAFVQAMLGEAFVGIGAYAKAEPLLGSALEIFERELGPDDLQCLTTRTRLAAVLNTVGRYEEAEVALGDADRRAREVHGAAHDATLRAQIARANLLKETGRYREAVALAEATRDAAERGTRPWLEALRVVAVSTELLGDSDGAIRVAREAYEVAGETRGERDPLSIRALETLAAHLGANERVDEARPLVERELELKYELLGEEHPDTLRALANAAHFHIYAKELERAEELLRRAVEVGERVLPPGHPTLMHSYNNLAATLGALGEHAEAAEFSRRAVELEIQVRGADHPNTLTATGNLAQSLEQLGRLDEAIRLKRDVLARRERIQGRSHPQTLVARYNLASTLLDHGGDPEAEELLRENVTLARETLPAGHKMLGIYISTFGKSLYRMSKDAEAEEALLEGLEILERTLPPDDPELKVTIARIADFYVQIGRPEEAAFFGGGGDE